jgi:putative FmdB family regulatory protein
MPIYEYEPQDGDCKICGGRFELRRPLDREPLKACPLCKKPVRKIVSAASTPRVAKPLSISSAKSAGFQVLKRNGDGAYEKQ